MEKIIKYFKDKSFFCLFIIILLLCLYNAYTFFQRYNILAIENVTSFSFWNYMRVYGVGELIMFFSPIAILILGINKIYKKITTSFLEFELMRTEYKPKMFKELILCYFKGSILFIVISIIIFVIGLILFPSDLSVLTYRDYLTYFPDEAMTNPFLYVFLYHILILLFCMFVINIGLIVMYYIKDFILIVIASFITLNGINFILGNVILFIAKIVNNEKFIEYAYDVNVYEGYMLQGTIGQAFIDIGILYIISLIIVMILYRNKEKVVMRFD